MRQMQTFARSSNSKTRYRAFTLLEVLVAVAILLTVSSLILRTMNSYRLRQGLDSAGETVATALSLARESTLSSRDDSVYGVHFESDRVIVYKGATYTPGASSNSTHLLPSTTFISTTTFSGGGSNILFNRLLGTTGNYGTTTIALRAATTSVRYVVILGTGVIEQR